MGWTRNYRNLIKAHAIFSTSSSTGITASSGWSFGDACPLNVKTCGGTIRDILVGNNYMYGQSAGFISLTNVNTLTARNLYTQVGSPRTTIATSGNMGNSFNYDYPYIYFSSDDTAESIEDYTISNVIPATSSINVTPTITNNYNGTYTLNASITFTPTTSGEIKSFGITKGMFAYYSSNPYYMEVLLYRALLAEPVTVTAQVPVTVNISITTPTITFS